MNFKRVIGLMKNDVFALKETLGYIYVIYISAASVLLSTSREHAWINLYLIVLHTGGFVLIRNVFLDLHNPNKGYRYLTLPASAFEKFFSRWFVTGILYALSFTLVTVFVYFLNKLVLMVDGSTSYFLDSFDIASPAVWHAILTYLVLHSVVFLGCIYFKKQALFKTTVLGMTLVTTFLLLAALSVYLLHPEDATFNWMFLLFEHGVFWGKSFFWVLLAPICLTLAYSQLKKCEA
jgi:hypothetical protein